LDVSHLKNTKVNQKTGFDFQVRYKPKRDEKDTITALQAVVKAEDSGADSEDSCIVFAPFV
jgi:hypothetical protein